MNPKTNIDIQTLRLLYNKYKPYLVPVCIFVSCVLLILFVIMPQVQNFLTAQSQEAQAKAKVTTLKQSIAVLSSLSDSQVNQNFQIATTAMPDSKDFAGVLSAITGAASKSNVTLGDYSFTPGNLSPGKDDLRSPTMQVTLTVNGGAQSATSFAQALLHSLPLSQINNIKINNSQTSLTVSFYYKPYPPAQANSQTAVLPFSIADTKLLDQLSLWLGQSQVPVGSSSAR
ncbi:MAG TPA: hypothetical protein VLF68_03430 [Candidatus Saccharimonadales bacterium]|nr:hypothetical protein [Candidatus Saccharimonadales bacterium]